VKRILAVGTLLIVAVSLAITVAWSRDGDPRPLVPNESTRILKPGDTWLYDTSATFIRGGSRQDKPGMTMLSIMNSGRNAKGMKAYLLRIDLQITNGVSTVDDSLLGQDASGGQYKLGKRWESGKWDPALNPQSMFPSRLSPTWKLKGKTRFKSGLVEFFDFRVVGTEQVTTGMGVFQAYKMRYSLQISNSRMDGTVWVTPDHPFGVKDQFVQTVGKGSHKWQLQASSILSGCTLH
jgi:hypothetical protein